MTLPAFSVKNPVMVNLMMALIVIFGGYFAVTTTREMFPNVDLDKIIISTAYRGATPEEVEDGILVRIEDDIASVEGIDNITSVATSSGGSITVDVQTDSDTGKVKDDIKVKIDAITDFPKNADDPQVMELEPMLPVIMISLHGDATMERLRDKAQEVRDAIRELDGVTQVSIDGIIDREITVNVDPDRLRRRNISMREIAAKIKAANIDLPGGTLKSQTRNTNIRMNGQLNYGYEIAQIPLRIDSNGTNLTVGDIGNVVDGFEDVPFSTSFNRERAVQIVVMKTPSEDAIKIADSVRAFVAGMQRNEMPEANPYLSAQVKTAYEKGLTLSNENLNVDLFTDLSSYIRQRMDTMKRNAFWGLLLVVLTLLVFLHWRVALWTSMGLPIAFLGTFIIMSFFGTTLNLITMFAMIIVLGMIVDDAIIIAENVYRRYEEGMSPKLAAVKGAEQVMWPVIGAVATTCAAFIPLAFLDGVIGKFMRSLAIVVTAALVVSLFEALIILPSHLAESIPLHRDEKAAGRFSIMRIQTGLLAWLNDKIYTPILQFILKWRYPFFGSAIALFLLVTGYTHATTRIQLTPDIPADRLNINLECDVGTPVTVTQTYIQKLDNMLAAYAFNAEKKTGSVKSVAAYAGIKISMGHPGDMAITDSSNLGTVMVEFADSELRDKEAPEIIDALQKETNTWSGVKVDYVQFRGGPTSGKEIGIELYGEDFSRMRALSKEIQKALKDYDGVFSISDNYEAGAPEDHIVLTDHGIAMGLTKEDVASQVRAAVYGLEATRLRRGEDEIKVLIRYPPSKRQSLGDIRNMDIVLPNGAVEPFHAVAYTVQNEGTTIIRRKNRKRLITVSADVTDTSKTRDIENALKAAHFDDWRKRYPDIDIKFGGAREDFNKTLVTLKRSSAFALLVIFCILAVEFNSFAQPLIIMVAIPFGLIGALVGHKILGMNLSMMSMIGMVALTGIVVNDSLVLIDFFNYNLKNTRMTLFEALVDASRKRLRPILLTSITTIAGLMPLLLEKSTQARFIIPCAVSISFGLMFSTVLILLIVPSIYYIYKDIMRIIKPLIFWKIPEPAFESGNGILTDTHLDTKPDTEPVPSPEIHREIDADPDDWIPNGAIPLDFERESSTSAPQDETDSGTSTP